MSRRLIANRIGFTLRDLRGVLHELEFPLCEGRYTVAAGLSAAPKVL